MTVPNGPTPTVSIDARLATRPASPYAWLTAFSLAFFALCVADLVLHPLAGSDAPSLLGDNGLAFRWLGMAAGTFSLAVGLFVVRRVPGNPIGSLLVAWAAGNTGFTLRNAWASPLAMGLAHAGLTLFFYSLAYPALANLLFRYPTGRVHPPWAKSAVRGLLALMALSGVLANLALYQRDGRLPANWLGGLLMPLAPALSRTFDALSLVVLLAALLSLGARFRQGTWRERQQLKWLLWSAAGALVIVAGLIVRVGVQPLQTLDPLTQALTVVLFLYVQVVPALAIAVAIVRHHVWDIDVIIRRTLVYTVVSAVLAAVYLGSVVVLQSLFQALTGQRQGEWVTVVSTLGIAALFAPVRQRVQRAVDQRFYRSKYDAARTLEAFARSLRDETDLARLSSRLVQVVEETMQPQGVSLWLKPE